MDLLRFALQRNKSILEMALYFTQKCKRDFPLPPQNIPVYQTSFSCLVFTFDKMIIIIMFVLLSFGLAAFHDLTLN